jgi:chromosome segregation ATPase
VVTLETEVASLHSQLVVANQATEAAKGESASVQGTLQAHQRKAESLAKQAAETEEERAGLAEELHGLRGEYVLV